MPELGRDPIQEMNEILNDPFNEKKQDQEKSEKKKGTETSGSQLLIDMQKDRRKLIE